MSEYTKTVCPNCGKRLTQLERDENRGVCQLCYESLSETEHYTGQVISKDFISKRGAE